MNRYLRVHAKIDLDAIYNNIQAVRQKIGEDVSLFAVIKADAYGHGAVPVGLHIQDLVDGYAVAIVEEGVELRKSGIQKNIIILGYTDPTQYAAILRYGMEQTVYAYDMAKRLSDLAVAMGSIAKIHIKLDTGMGRLGFLPNEQSIEAIKDISRLPNICIEGLYTHFAKADMEDREYTDNQLNTFISFAKQLEAAGVPIHVKHAANSAAIMDYPESYFDQVRCGIVTYGLYPSKEIEQQHLNITPAMELKTHIVAVKEVPEGTSIGYGGTYVTKGVRRIATIPVGYGDGYPRSLSNKGRVLIRGQSAPIVGRICMDQFMVDITDILDAREGDTVVLVGKDGDAILPVEEVADIAGSFNYEFCCNIGRRIPRVYYKNGRYDKVVHYLKW